MGRFAIGGLASLLQTVEAHHHKALETVSLMLQRLDAEEPAFQVKADALSMLELKERELMDVFSDKCQDAEALMQYGANQLLSAWYSAASFLMSGLRLKSVACTVSE